MALFDDVRYWLSESLPPERQDIQRNYLDSNGAQAVDSIEDATHIITNSEQFEGWKRVEDGDVNAAVVTEQWVYRSMVLGKAQPPQFYSANPALVFSGVVACAADLTTADLEVISAGVTGLGGQWRNGLTRDVTHLFALGPGSNKYETAMHYQVDTKMKVILPHWFDDAVTLGIGGLPTDGYEWPEPKYLKEYPDDGEEGGEKKAWMRRGHFSSDKKQLFKSIGWHDIPVDVEAKAVVPNIWANRKILLSINLELKGTRREAVEAGIKRGGGEVVTYKKAKGDGDEAEETRKVNEADIFITRYRHGVAYIKALKAEKTIGTLAWLFHVESTGVFTPPTDQLLHYPIFKKLIPGFSAHKITVTNYTGESREYLKKLVVSMGAEFTANMSGQNTVVIAAYIQGAKSTKATNWSIPIVNHTWLEDCFIQWRNLSVGIEKYIRFPPGVDFSKLLGERGPGRRPMQIDLEREEELLQEDIETRDLFALDIEGEKVEGVWWKDKSEEEKQKEEGERIRKAAVTAVDAAMDVDEEKKQKKMTSTPTKKTRKDRGQPVGTATSAKDVEEVVGLLDGGIGDDVYMDIDGEEPAEEVLISPPKNTKKSPKRKTRISSDEDEEVEVVQERITKPKRKLVKRAGTRKEPRLEKDSTPDEPGPSTTNGNKRLLDLPDLDDESEVEDIYSLSRAKSTAKPKSKVPAAPPADDTDDDEHPPPKKPVRTTTTAAKGKAKEVEPAVRTPKRVVSVVIETSSGNKKKTGINRTESLRAEADEAHVTSSPKRDRPAKGGTSKPNVYSTGRGSIGGTPPSMTRTPSKRSAHIKAASNLHDVMMPDLMNYAQEKKRKFKGKESDRVSSEPISGKSRKRTSDANDPQSSDDEVAERKKKRRISTGNSKKVHNAPSDSESEAPNLARKGLKKTRIVVPENDGGDETGAEDVENDARVSAHNRTSKTGSKMVKLMTTQVTLSDDVIKSLTRLGVKFTTRPAECTHLLVPHLVRTEKFLCAMAVAPYILKEEWASKSAASKQILPEDKYLLQDSRNEQKYNFKLSDALRRSKANGGRLFEKMTFYVTSKIPVDVKLLKNVVSAGGGQVLTATPTVRILKANANRHVVSCPEDASIWRPLAEAGFTIYSPELLLTGAMRQELDWDNDANKIPDSY